MSLMMMIIDQSSRRESAFSFSGGTVADWVIALDWRPYCVVLGSNAAAATSLRNFGNSIYFALPVTVSFGGDTNCD